MNSFVIQIYECYSVNDAILLSKLNVHNVGFFLGLKDEEYEQRKKLILELFNYIPKHINKVILTLTNNLKLIEKVIEELKPDIMHLGALEEELNSRSVSEIKNKFPKQKLMRSIAISGPEAILIAKSYEKVVDFVMTDSYCPKTKVCGALGKIHDWNIDREIVRQLSIPVIIAGGLGPDNVEEAIRYIRPYGVDSKSLTDDNVTKEKCPSKTKDFVEKTVKAYNSSFTKF